MAEILVEFVPDFSKLETGVDQLVSSNTISKEMAALFTDAGKTIDQFGAKFAKLGEPAQKALKPAIDAAKKSIADLSTSGIKDLGELKKRVDGISKSFIDGFGEGVEQALKEAGVSMKQLNDEVTKNVNTDKSLKAELRQINEELAKMKLNGQGNSQQYAELSKKAGQYRDTIQDVNEEINRQASDTQKLDVAIRFVTGLASAYSVLQGVQALAGKDNEELQKTLLKVNAAMSILNGLQSIQNELKRKDNILTIAQTAAQKTYALVVGSSTGALKAFRIALASTGIGLLVLAIGALVANWDKIRTAMGGVSESQQDLIDNAEKLVETGEENLDLLDAQAETLKRQGVSEEEIVRMKIKQLELNKKAQLDLLETRRLTLESQREAQARSFSITKTIIDIITIPVTALSKLIGLITGQKLPTLGDIIGTKLFDPNEVDAEFNELEKKIKLETTQIQGEIDGLYNGLDDKRKQSAEKAAADRAKLDKEEFERRTALINKVLENEIAQIKLKLVEVEKGSRDELELRKKLSQAQLRLELTNDKLSSDQQRLLIAESFKERRDLTDQFNAENKKKALEDQASLIAAELAALNISFEDKERLLVEQLEIERALQLNAVVNNKTKEKEINAKIDKEIFEQRKRIRDEAFAKEQADDERRGFIKKKKDEELAADPSAEFDERREAIERLRNDEQKGFIDERINNQKQLQDKLVDLNGYAAKAEDINNRAFVAQSNREKELTALTKDEQEKRKEIFLHNLDFIVGVTNDLTSAFRSFQEVMNANEDERIQSQKDNLQRLREGNAITEKEFLARMKNIEKAERETKQRQAERDKSLAVFEAVINGANAVIKAFAQGGPVLAAVTAALVAAQIAAIVARPIPKFGKGTKSAPKGFAEVGETGTEIIQMGDKYFVAEHPQVIWMKGGERVYNPEETKDILTPQANMTVINNTNGVSHEKSIDYKKMAKELGDEIAKHPRLINNIDADGYSLHIIEGLNKSTYLNKRFTFK